MNIPVGMCLPAINRVSKYVVGFPVDLCVELHACVP